VLNIPGALVVYDQSAQKVYFFIANKVLVLFKDLLSDASADVGIAAGLSPWSVYTTLHPNAFNTVAAKYMQEPNTINYHVYWGDSSGNIYDMTGAGTGGDAGAYTIDCKRTSKLIDISVIAPFPWLESILSGKVQFRRKTVDSTLSLSFAWVDEFNTSLSTVALKGPAAGVSVSAWNKNNYWGGGSYWNQGNQLANVISNQTFSPTGKGGGFYLTLQNQTASQFQVDHVELK
jgi:hypothetical protein